MLSCSHTCSPCFHVKQPHPTRIRAIRDQSWSSRPRSCPWLASTTWAVSQQVSVSAKTSPRTSSGPWILPDSRMKVIPGP